MKNNKILLLFIALSLGILPSVAKLDGRISRQHFYDPEKTIMTAPEVNEILKTGKYWERNLLYFNKYKPLFMLSNKDLYDLMPKDNVSITQRITAPSVYNISLKHSTIKTVALTQQPVKKTIAKNVSNQKVASNETKSSSNKTFALMYEDAKNPGVEPEKKIDTAIMLMNSKKNVNYNFAIDLLNDVIRKEPYNAYAYYIKGEIYSSLGNAEEAMKNYVEALKINPESKQTCLGVAKILETTNKELAQKYYEMAKGD